MRRPEPVLLRLISAGIQASRSPELHEAAAAALGLHLFYHLIDAQELGFEAADPPVAVKRLWFAPRRPI